MAVHPVLSHGNINSCSLFARKRGSLATGCLLAEGAACAPVCELSRVSGPVTAGLSGYSCAQGLGADSWGAGDGALLGFRLLR